MFGSLKNPAVFSLLPILRDILRESIREPIAEASFPSSNLDS